MLEGGRITKWLTNEQDHLLSSYIAHFLSMMDGWITSDFTSFSTVFQSYQDDVRLIMKGCVHWNCVMVEKILPLVGIELCLLDQ